MLKLTRYQWTVLAAAWLGWGFDVFDGLLFNYVAPTTSRQLPRAFQCWATCSATI